mgnify:CR=1 FL=1
MNNCGSKMTVAQLKVAVKAKFPKLAVSKLNKPALLDYLEGRKRANPKFAKLAPAIVKKLDASKKAGFGNTPKVAALLKGVKAGMAAKKATPVPKKENVPTGLMMKIRKDATDSIRKEVMGPFMTLRAKVERQIKDAVSQVSEYVQDFERGEFIVYDEESYGEEDDDDYMPSAMDEHHGLQMAVDRERDKIYRAVYSLAVAIRGSPRFIKGVMNDTADRNRYLNPIRQLLNGKRYKNAIDLFEEQIHRGWYKPYTGRANSFYYTSLGEAAGDITKLNFKGWKKHPFWPKMKSLKEEEERAGYNRKDD